MINELAPIDQAKPSVRREACSLAISNNIYSKQDQRSLLHQKTVIKTPSTPMNLQKEMNSKNKI